MYIRTYTSGIGVTQPQYRYRYPTNHCASQVSSDIQHKQVGWFNCCDTILMLWLNIMTGGLSHHPPAFSLHRPPLSQHYLWTPEWKLSIWWANLMLELWESDGSTDVWLVFFWLVRTIRKHFCSPFKKWQEGNADLLVLHQTLHFTPNLILYLHPLSALIDITMACKTTSERRVFQI